MSGRDDDVSPAWVVLVIGGIVLAGYLVVKWMDRDATAPVVAARPGQENVVQGGCDREQRVAAQQFIAAHGYSCESVDFCSQSALGKSVRVSCNGNYYGYTLEDHGGKWSVTAR